ASRRKFLRFAREAKPQLSRQPRTCRRAAISPRPVRSWTGSAERQILPTSRAQPPRLLVVLLIAPFNPGARYFFSKFRSSRLEINQVDIVWDGALFNKVRQFRHEAARQAFPRQNSDIDVTRVADAAACTGTKQPHLRVVALKRIQHHLAQLLDRPF